MTRCYRCNKLLLFATNSGYCKECDVIVKQEEARRQVEVERKRQEEARLKAEEERKRQEEKARLKAEEEQKRQEETRLKAEEERKRQEEARLKAEEERKRKEEMANIEKERRYAEAVKRLEEAVTIHELVAVRQIFISLKFIGYRYEDSGKKILQCENRIEALREKEPEEVLKKYYSNGINQDDIIKAIKDHTIGVNSAYQSDGNSLTILSLAIGKNDLKLVDCLIANGCDTDLESHVIKQDVNLYLTPLCIAAEKRNIAVLNKLLEAGANIHKKNRLSGGLNGIGVMSVLSLAASCCEADALKLLIEYGADPNEEDHDNSGSSFPLSYAIFAHRYDNVKQLIKSGADVNHILRSPHADFALLNWTVMNNDIEGFDILMNAHADPNCVRISHEGWGDNPAVCDAVSERRHDMVFRLLQAGAKKDSVVLVNGKRYTLVQMAKMNGDSRMLGILNSFGITEA